MNLIAQKNASLRQRWLNILNKMKPMENWVECDDWDCTLLELIQSGSIEYLFLDINVVGVSWPQRCKDLLATLENTKLILTGSENIDKKSLFRCIEEGLWSYVPNEYIDTLGQSIMNLILSKGQYFPAFLMKSYEHNDNCDIERPFVLPSGEHLTRRQKEVLSYLQQGLSNKQIAGKMNISEPTVKLHIHGLFNKLKATNRTQIVLKAHELGFV